MAASRARRSLVAFVALWCALAPAVASATADTCPFPLGDSLVTGDVRVVSGSMDAPESLALDVSWYGVLFSEGHFATDGSRVAVAYETEFDYRFYNRTLRAESHIIAYKEFSPRTGWDTRPVFVSSSDMDWPLPVADSTSPAIATVGNDMWIAWTVAGHVQGTWGVANPAPFWPDAGSYIMLRGNHDGTWGPMQPLSDLGPVSGNNRVQAVSTRNGAYFAYQTNAHEAFADQFHIVGRSFDGRVLGPVEPISVGQDGWSDETAALATNGQQVAAVYAVRNATDFANGSTQVALRIREPSGAWSDERVVSPPGERDVTAPTVVWHDNQWFVAWSAVDPQASPAGDSSVLLRHFDPLAAALSPVVFVTNESFPGFEKSPALASYGGRLYIAYTSNSEETGRGDTTADPDIHVRQWDGGALSAVSLVDDRPGERDVALWPGFFKAGGALYATYGLNLNQTTGLGGLSSHNQREVIRQLARPERPQDNLTATYSIRPGAFLGSGLARVNVRFLMAGRTANVSDHYAIRAGDGSLIRLPGGAAEWNISMAYRENKFLPPASAYWCGQPVALREEPWPFPPPPPPSWIPTLNALAPVLGIAIVGALLAARVRRSRQRANQRRTARQFSAANGEKPDTQEGEER
jgi:hypothetical protein